MASSAWHCFLFFVLQAESGATAADGGNWKD
jgi:hypothetical protein